MTNTEKQLIKLFSLNKITKEEFLKGYPVDLARDNQYILSVLRDSYKAQDAVEVEYGLMLLSLDDFTRSEKYVAILNELILVSWHKRHEDIAALLKGIKSPSSVSALYEAAMIQHDYLDYDDTYQLARKCIKALAAIDNAEAIEKLQALSQCLVPEIAEYARKELRYKSLM